MFLSAVSARTHAISEQKDALALPFSRFSAEFVCFCHPGRQNPRIFEQWMGLHFKKASHIKLIYFRMPLNFNRRAPHAFVGREWDCRSIFITIENWFARAWKKERVLLFSSFLLAPYLGYCVRLTRYVIIYEEASSQYARLNFLPVTQRFENS